MNRIEKLIKEKCPDGVKRLNLGNCTTIIRGRRVTKKDLIPDGKYPVVSGGTSPMGFINEYNREENTITISQYGTAGYVDFQNQKFWANDVCYSIYPNEMITNRYLWYALKNKQEYLYSIRNTDAVPYSLPLDVLKTVEIPLPPLPIQQEIVKILDSFTALQQNLEEELKLRQKQYEHYREKLLTFEDGDVEWKKLGELFTFKNGLNKGKEFFGSGRPIIMFSRVFNNRALFEPMIDSYVDITESELSRINANRGDVFFTRTSETQEDVGMSSVLLDDIKGCTYAGFLIRARPINDCLLPEYCKYCFTTSKMRTNIVSKSIFTTRASLTGTGLSEISIPIPSLEKQTKIVQTLDHFESLISNLKTEIELRKKQYEYYREKLLTFE